MEYLHKHKEEFINAVNLASEYFHILPVIVEKDYYVTMILRELTERQILKIHLIISVQISFEKCTLILYHPAIFQLLSLCSISSYCDICVAFV